MVPKHLKVLPHLCYHDVSVVHRETSPWNTRRWSNLNCTRGTGWKWSEILMTIRCFSRGSSRCSCGRPFCPPSEWSRTMVRRKSSTHRQHLSHLSWDPVSLWSDRPRCMKMRKRNRLRVLWSRLSNPRDHRIGKWKGRNQYVIQTP